MTINGEVLLRILIDFCWLSVLLLAGKLIRAKVPLFQRLFLPASIIGGFLGLLLGPYGIGRLGFELIEGDVLSTWSAFPGILINVVFACLFLGFHIPSLRRIWREGGPQICYGWTVGMGHYMVGIGLTVLLLEPLFGVPAIFGTLIEIGFSGGHGTAAGMKEAFTELGFPAGSELGLMSATVGVISAVVFGMIMINMAARRGYTKVIKSPEELSHDEIRGLIPEGRRESGSSITTAPSALEPLAFHGAFVGLAILIGWYLLKGIKALSHGMEPDLFASFPLFPMAMIGGIMVQLFSAKVGLATYLDRKTFDRILGLSLDFLVLSAIASIKLDVFVDLFWPFTLLMLAGLAWVIFATWFLAPRMLPGAWFERGITEYGMQTGVTALGLLLLRVADPKFETEAAESFGFKQIIYEPLMGGGFITASAPILMVTFGVGAVYLAGALSILVAVAVAYFSGWLRWRVH